MRRALWALLLPLVALAAAPGRLGAQQVPPTAPAASPAAAPLDCPAERELCVQAERSGGIDLKSGVAHLEGNVNGIVRSRGLRFSGHSLMAFRNGGQDWVRLVLDQEVRLDQRDRSSTSDHGVLEREEIRLTGHVRIEQPDLRIEGHEATARSDGSRTVVHGQPQAPLRMVVARALLVASDQPAPPPDQPTRTTVFAQKAVIEDPPRRIILTGNVHVEQSDQQLRIDAQQVTLSFYEGSELESFQAEGNVVIAQPDRRIAADFAQSRNQLKTILLVGHASMQQEGGFDLKSDRMEVYADASKGIMQSDDRQKPITLSLDLAGGQTYGLTQAGVLALTDRGVPPPVLERLTSLIGHTYPSRAAFREAASQRLTRRQAEVHLDTIIAHAR